MDSTDNCIKWFEIPVDNLQRAKHFYQKIFNIEMRENTIMGMQMAFFPSDQGNGKVGGALVKSDNHKPNTEGVLIYLNANPDIAAVLIRIEEEGGMVFMQKTKIDPGTGYIAIYMDTEGNRIALYAES